MKYKEVDVLLKGSEINKAVWGHIKKREPIKMSTLVDRLGYQASNLSTAMKFLVNNGIAERYKFNGKEVRGTYVIKENVVRY